MNWGSDAAYYGLTRRCPYCQADVPVGHDCTCPGARAMRTYDQPHETEYTSYERPGDYVEPPDPVPDLLTVIEQRVDSRIQLLFAKHEQRIALLLEQAAQAADRLAVAAVEDDDDPEALAAAVAAVKAHLRAYCTTDRDAGHVPGSLELEVRATTLVQVVQTALDRGSPHDPR